MLKLLLSGQLWGLLVILLSLSRGAATVKSQRPTIPIDTIGKPCVESSRQIESSLRMECGLCTHIAIRMVGQNVYYACTSCKKGHKAKKDMKLMPSTSHRGTVLDIGRYECVSEPTLTTTFFFFLCFLGFILFVTSIYCLKVLGFNRQEIKSKHHLIERDIEI